VIFSYWGVEFFNLFKRLSGEVRKAQVFFLNDEVAQSTSCRFLKRRSCKQFKKGAAFPQGAYIDVRNQGKT
jgi:hypothetical protein